MSQFTFDPNQKIDANNPNFHFWRYRWKAGELDTLKNVLKITNAVLQDAEENIMPHTTDVTKMRQFYTERAQNALVLQQKQKIADYKTRYDASKASFDACDKLQDRATWEKLNRETDNLRRAVQEATTTYDDMMKNKWNNEIGDNLTMVYPYPLQYEPFNLDMSSLVITHIIKGSIIIKPNAISMLIDNDTALAATAGASVTNEARDHKFYTRLTIQPAQINCVSYDVTVPVGKNPLANQVP